MVSQSDEQIVGADQHGHISFASTKMSLSAEVMIETARAPITIRPVSNCAANLSDTGLIGVVSSTHASVFCKPFGESKVFQVIISTVANCQTLPAALASESRKPFLLMEGYHRGSLLRRKPY